MPCRVVTVQLLVMVLFAYAALAQAQNGGGVSATSPTTVPATTTTSPTTEPEEIVENPFYLAWAKYKPGTQVEFDLKSDAAGQEMKTHLIQRLVEVTAEQAVVEVEAHIEVPGVANPPQPQKQSRTLPARVPKSQAQKDLLPRGAEGETKDGGSETIQVGGKDYACNVIEFEGKIGAGDAMSKQWRSDQIPGGLVKLESSTPVMKVELIVTKVAAK